MCHICNQPASIPCGCQPINVPCGCGDTPCVESPTCDCAVSDLGTKCLVYSGETLECTGIEQGVNFDDFLLALDTYICTAISQLQASFNLINVGDGAEIYAGIDNLGKRKIRTLTETGNLIDIVENENTINIAINEANLNTFIEANQKTYTALNVGTGATLFKNLTTVGDVNTFNFKSVILDAQSGLGESFIRDVLQNTNDVTIRHKKLNSSTLTITSTDEEVLINVPSTSTIPALYVNNLYVPSEEEFLAGNTFGTGTLNSPFTDTVTAYVAGVPTITPNTAIQNALTAFIGSGTALAPELVGQKIIIQNNNGTYTFPGNFSVSGLDIELQGNVLSTTTGYLVDMDDATKFNATTSTCKITRNKGTILQIQGNGFNNSGNTGATNTFATGRILSLLGEGLIYSATNDITKYILNVDITNSGNNNDGNLCILTEGDIRADFQGIYLVGGGGRLDNFGTYISGITSAVNLALKAYHQTGGQVRFFEGSTQSFGVTRTNAITFTPTGGFTPTYISQGCTYSGVATNLFTKTASNPVNFEVTSSNSYYSLVVTNIFASSDKWQVRFTNNIFGSGIIDTLVADLTLTNTVSSINTIGSNLVETLIRFGSRTLAEASLPVGSKFINTNSANVDPDTWFIDITMQ